MFSAFATMKTTNSNGSWFDPGIWSPFGVPLMEDSVIINHDVTVTGNYVDFGANWLIVNTNASIIGDTIFSLHGNLKLYGSMDCNIIAIGDGDSTLVFGEVYGRKYVPGNPINHNYGAIYADSLVLGDTFDNYGTIEVAMFVSGGPSYTNYTGSALNVNLDATFGSITTNELGAVMDLGSLVTSENMTNNGDVICFNWTHGQGIVSGTTGRFCINNCFSNVSSIVGTVDICDATSTFCDFNLGTIAATVTFCDMGACSNLALAESSEVRFSVYPNPVNDELGVTILIDDSFQITNLKGEVVLKGKSESNQIINVASLSPGMYFLSSGTKTLRFVKL
jgi:hypothetical protein